MTPCSTARVPRFARRLLDLTLPADAREYVISDLNDVFQAHAGRHGALRARLWYWREAVSFSARFTRERMRERRDADGGLVVRTTHSSPPRGPRRNLLQRVLEAWGSDFTHAIRRLRRAPGFAVVTVVTLALAIGANTAMFGVVDAVLINPLSLPEADRLVSIRGIAPGTDTPGEFALAPEFYVSYRDEADKLDSLGMFQSVQTTVRTPERVDRLFAVVGTSSLFTTLGARPLLGRLPDADDDANTAPVVVISHWLWTAWFGADPGVLNRSIEAGGAARTIIGVMGPDFRFPNAQTALWARASIADESRIVPGRLGFGLIGRLKPGITPDNLAEQLAPIAKRLPERFGGTANYQQLIEKHQPVVRELEALLVGNVARPLWILLGTAGIVLLIACANIANLFIVRAESQRRALAVRQALGAGRGALIRSLMSEALVLGALGGLGGVVLARAAVRVLVGAAPQGIPNLDRVTLDVSALLFTAGVSLLAACIIGLLPALRVSAPSFAGDLRHGGRGATARTQLARNALVIVQTASALVLLVGAGLLVRSFWALNRVDPGFDTRNIFTFQVAPERRTQLVDGPTWAQFHQELIDRLRAIPGVESVGFVNELPFDEGAAVSRYVTERTAATGALAPRVMYTYTGGDYFQTMSIPLVGGRLFAPTDGLGSANALVSRAAADLLWPGENPIGKRFRSAESSTAVWHTVVGVVGDVRLDSFRQQTADPLIYFPTVGPEPRSWAVGTPAYVVKSPRDTIHADVQAVLREYAPEAPMYRVFTMRELASRSMAGLSFTMLMIAIGAGLALVLGAIGIYGVLSYVVSRRTREIAVRMALGAKASTVRRMVVVQGGRVTLIGIAIGLVAAFGATRVLETLLFGVKALDPLTFIAMAAAMLVVALLASYIPARRASSVDPLQSLGVD